MGQTALKPPNGLEEHRFFGIMGACANKQRTVTTTCLGQDFLAGIPAGVHTVNFEIACHPNTSGIRARGNKALRISLRLHATRSNALQDWTKNGGEQAIAPLCTAGEAPAH